MDATVTNGADHRLHNKTATYMGPTPTFRPYVPLAVFRFRAHPKATDRAVPKLQIKTASYMGPTRGKWPPGEMVDYFFSRGVSVVRRDGAVGAEDLASLLELSLIMRRTSFSESAWAMASS